MGSVTGFSFSTARLKLSDAYFSVWIELNSSSEITENCFPSAHPSYWSNSDLILTQFFLDSRISTFSPNNNWLTISERSELSARKGATLTWQIAYFIFYLFV